MRKAVSLFIIAALVMCSSTFAFAGETSTDGSSAGQTITKEISAKMEAHAEKLGIDISGMTREEAKAAIEAAALSRLTERAEKLGIDITNMTREEARAAVEQAVLAKLQLTADKLGADISGLDKSEAKALLKELKEQKQAAKEAKQGSQDPTN